jgi:hypothetical protein
MSAILLIVLWSQNNYYCENYSSGGLTSLYSNYGIQDRYLTIPDDANYIYRERFPWYLPTRGLESMSYYPYLYEFQMDRYAIPGYPYW